MTPIIQILYLCFFIDLLKFRAVECFEGALRISRDLLGSGHEKVADTLYSLGQVYQKIGKYENALESYNEALNVSNEILTRFIEVSLLHEISTTIFNVTFSDSKR